MQPFLIVTLTTYLREFIMNDFLIDVVFDEDYNSYIAMYSDGKTICLDSTNYHDAVLEADMLEVA